MTDAVEVAGAIPESRKARTLASVEARDASQIVEGQGAQSMTLGIVEGAGELFGGTLCAAGCAAGCTAGLPTRLEALHVTRHESPDGGTGRPCALR
jgi:hypothetical protein